MVVRSLLVSVLERVLEVNGCRETWFTSTQHYCHTALPGYASLCDIVGLVSVQNKIIYSINDIFFELSNIY